MIERTTIDELCGCGACIECEFGVGRKRTHITREIAECNHSFQATATVGIIKCVKCKYEAELIHGVS